MSVASAQAHQEIMKPRDVGQRGGHTKHLIIASAYLYEMGS